MSIEERLRLKQQKKAAKNKAKQEQTTNASRVEAQIDPCSRSIGPAGDRSEGI
jgi:hypothetical protein